MRKKMSKKAIAITITATLVLGGAGAAFAYWTTTGNQAGTAKAAATADTLVFTPVNTINTIKPNGAPIVLTGTITNTTANSSSYVGTVTPSITSVTDSNDAEWVASDETCSVADFLINGTITVDKEVTSTTPFTWGAVEGDATIAFVNSSTRNQDECKGKTVNINYAW